MARECIVRPSLEYLNFSIVHPPVILPAKHGIPGSGAKPEEDSHGDEGEDLKDPGSDDDSSAFGNAERGGLFLAIGISSARNGSVLPAAVVFAVYVALGQVFLEIGRAGHVEPVAATADAGV